MFITFHMLSMHHLSCVVTESEEVVVDQAPEEVHPPVEVRFDICGSSEELDYLANAGKPGA
jgi:hypothetical protein